MEVVDRLPSDRSKVRFGAVVTLMDQRNETLSYRIVGADETDARLGWISIDSPVALVLLGKKSGDDVTVKLPRETKNYRILKIEYPDPST